MKAKDINISVSVNTHARLEDIIRYYIQENHGTPTSEQYVKRACEKVDSVIMNAVFDEQERIIEGMRKFETPTSSDSRRLL